MDCRQSRQRSRYVQWQWISGRRSNILFSINIVTICQHIREKLLNAANATVALDKEMSSVRGEIMDAQNSFNYKASVVADILTNIQNLYYVGNQREVVKIQNEFYDIYQKDDLEKLEDFSKQLDIIAEGYKAQGL